MRWWHWGCITPLNRLRLCHLLARVHDGRPRLLVDIRELGVFIDEEDGRVVVKRRDAHVGDG
jgi:hypothetical protein